MEDSPFTDNFPLNFGMGDAWTHVHGTRPLDAEYLGTEPPAIDQTLDWENFLNLDQVELGVFPPGPPLDIGTRTFQYCGLPGQETAVFADQGQEKKLELDSPGGSGNTESLKSPPTLSCKRKFSDFQEGCSRGPNGNQHLSRGASKGGSSGQNRIPKKAKATLMAWLEENQHDPYPDKRKIEDLSVSAGLELTKVRNWLNNARQRHLPKFSLAVSDAVVDGRNGSVIPGDNTYEAQNPQVPAFRVAMAPHSDITTKRPRQLSPPMERYLASPPEHEAAPLAAVEAAAENTEFNFEYASCITQEAWAKRSEGSQDYTGCDGLSISGSGTSVISSSTISYSSLSSQYPRKGRRRAQRTHSSQDTSSSKFQCTFCSKGFQTIYDWKRHEESRHVPQEEWVCMPDNAQILCDYKIKDSKFVCTFCDSADASYAHLESAHNIHACLFKEIPERTFTRKDHLVQHIRHTHKAVGETPYVQNWSRPIRYNHDWGCGFCGEKLDTWSARVSHIARHFAKGLRMDSWLNFQFYSLPSF